MGYDDADSGRFDPASRFITIEMRQWVRRFRKSVASGAESFAFLLGSGCSVSSGVPDATECVKKWLREIKYFETGDETGVDAWARSRFVNYGRAPLAALYAEAFRINFFNESHQRQEMEKLLASCEPGFGYAVLAQLMTHPTWGERLNLAFSVNYDDLASEALHIYSQRRPQVFGPESLGLRTPVSEASPTLIKLMGDAHLEIPPGANRPQIREEAAERMRQMLGSRALIIIGYGGRDESVAELLEGLPVGAPAGGVYWINEEAPSGRLGQWLEERKAIWVEHSNFDELMYFVRSELGLGHPPVDRLERGFDRYNSQFLTLATQHGMPSLGEDKKPLNFRRRLPRPGGDRGDGEAGAPALPEAPKVGPVSGGLARTQHERLRDGLRAYTKALENVQLNHRGGSGGANPAALEHTDDMGALLDLATLELYGEVRAGCGPIGAAPELDPVNRNAGRASSEDGEDSSLTGSLSLVTPAVEDAQPVEPAKDGPETIDAVLAQLHDDAGLEMPEPDSATERGEGRVALTSETARIAAKNALAPAAEREARPDFPDIEGFQNRFMRLGAKLQTGAAETGPVAPAEAQRAPGDPLPPEPTRQLATEEAAAGDLALVSAIEADPYDPLLRLRRARFLAVATADLAGAEAVYEEAQQVGPDNVQVLREYAGFCLDHLRDPIRAERLLIQAINLDLHDPETLRMLASYLLRAYGEVAEAQTCLRLAKSVAPNCAGARVDLAQILLIRCGERDLAEAELSAAAEIDENDPAPVAEHALFLIQQGGGLQEAQKVVERAERAAERAATGEFEHDATAGETPPPESRSIVRLARAALLDAFGDVESAEAHYRAAVEAAPRSVRAQLAFARFLHRRRGAAGAADAQFKAAIAIAPWRAEPLTAYAQFQETRRAAERARLAREHGAGAPAKLTDALDGAPTEPGPEFEACLAPADAARLAEFLSTAEAHHRKAIDAEPFNPISLAAFAEHLAAREEMADEAETLFKDALSLFSNSTEIRIAYGRFLGERRGLPDAAEAELRGAVEADPTSLSALEALARFVHEVREDAAEAEIIFRRALKHAPDRASALKRFARFARSAANEIGSVKDVYRKAYEDRATDAETLARSAQFLLARGDRREGLRVLTDAFDAAYRIEEQVRSQALLLELWIYRYAHDPARRDQSYDAAYGLIEAGVRCDGWDMSENVDAALRANHPEPTVLGDLVAVATQGSNPAILKARRF